MKSSYVAPILLVLRVLGQWPIARTKWNFINKIHRVYGYFVITSFIIFVLTQYADIILHLNDDVTILISNLTVSLLYFTTTYKTLVIRSGKIHKIVHLIERSEAVVDDLGSEDAEIKRIFQSNMKLNNFYNKFLSVFSVSTIVPFFVAPTIGLFTMTENRPLPFNSWFPFDKDKHFILAYVIHFCAGNLGGCLTCLTDLFYWSLMMYFIGQLKILQHKFKTLESKSRLIGERSNQSFDALLSANLKKSIKLHQLIISYVNHLNSALKPLMLTDFGICTMQIGIIGFQIITTDFGMDQLFGFEYLAAMLLQMFLFYWHANDIRLESLKIADALWETYSYEFPKSVQNSMRFCMRRAQKPLTLNIGNFAPMSTATVITVLRGSYSYVALMSEIYNKSST